MNFPSLSSETPGAVSSMMSSIISIPNSLSTNSIIPLLKQNNHENEQNLTLRKRRASPRTILMAEISRRLLKRKVLYNQLYKISIIMCFLGLFGIILMIINNEMIFLNISNKKLNICWFIKLLITITTIILVGFVFYYRRLDLDLYAINNSLNHWRVGLTTTKICLTLFEALICLIHPISLTKPFITNIQNTTKFNSTSQNQITLDVALGLPMFARLYLICRFMMFNSHLVRDAFSQSLGSLNQVSVNFHFLLKTYLQQWPTRCLVIFCILLFLISSWSLRACNYKSTIVQISILDAMWLFIVTFSTVGYGDLTPTTFCGRTVAAITAMIGVLSTALLISVLAQKLELSRSEKYVHNFVLNMKIAKERRHQAANVIKFVLKLWFLKRKHELSSNQYISTQRGLVRSIHFNQKLKQEQKRLIDNCIGLPELIVTQRHTNDKIYENTNILNQMKLKIEIIEHKIHQIDHTMINIQNTLQLLINKISK